MPIKSELSLPVMYHANQSCKIASASWLTKPVSSLFNMSRVVPDCKRVVEAQDGAFRRAAQGQAIPKVLGIAAVPDTSNQGLRPPAAESGAVCTVVGHEQTC